MTQGDKIANVQVRVENDPAATEAVVAVYLSDAEDAIMRRLYRAYGYVPTGAVMPAQYDLLQCKIAAWEFLRRGGQGEDAHNENGVNRSYHSTDNEELLKEVMPFARVIG